MAYFTDFQDYFLLCSDISPEEKRKLNDYLRILELNGPLWDKFSRSQRHFLRFCNNLVVA